MHFRLGTLFCVPRVCRSGPCLIYRYVDSWKDADPQCVFISTLANENNWKVGNCYSKEAFACKVDVGQKIHEEPIDVPDYYCAQSPDYLETPFKLYQDDITGPKCFQFLKNSGDITGTAKSWDKSKERCEEQGAVLASIHSPQQNAWFSSHIPVNYSSFSQNAKKMFRILTFGLGWAT